MRSNASEVEKALWGMDYPKQKQEILDYARQHDASKNIMDDLREIQDKSYNSQEEIRSQFESSSSESSQQPGYGSSHGGSSQSFGGRGGQ